MWDPSLSSFSVWSLEATSAGLSAGPHTGFHTVLSGSIRQVDEPGREMKDLKTWIQLRRSEGSIVTDLSPKISFGSYSPDKACSNYLHCLILTSMEIPAEFWPRKDGYVRASCLIMFTTKLLQYIFTSSKVIFLCSLIS